MINDFFPYFDKKKTFPQPASIIKSGWSKGEGEEFC